MAGPQRYALIIPALDEADSLAILLNQISRDQLAQIFVVDNGSRDGTAEVARVAGVEVVVEPRRGYGRACLAGLERLRPEITTVAFMDADLSDSPGDLGRLMRFFEDGDWDLVIGSRVLGQPEPGSLTPLQRFGNWLTTRLIRWIWRVSYTDLGPLRIVRREALRRLNLSDTNFGWNVEMQAKAAQLGLRVAEIPVSYRRRKFGQSKISGTVWGSFQAGFKILWTIFRCWSTPAGPRSRPQPNGC